MRVEGHVGPSIVWDGTEGIGFRQGRGGELVISELHGKYYEQCSRGNMYYGASATAGLALTNPTGNPDAQGHPTLHNPLGSNVNCSLTHLYLAYTAGTTAINAICWAYTLNCGAAPVTGGPLLSYTIIPSVNALVGGQNVSKGRFSVANSFTSGNPVIFAGTGIGLTALAQASTMVPFSVIVAYDGALVVSPGSALTLVSSTATTTATFNVTFVWEEVPI